MARRWCSTSSERCSLCKCRRSCSEIKRIFPHFLVKSCSYDYTFRHISSTTLGVLCRGIQVFIVHTYQIGHHTVGGEYAVVNLIPVESVSRKEIHDRHFTWNTIHRLVNSEWWVPEHFCSRHFYCSGWVVSVGRCTLCNLPIDLQPWIFAIRHWKHSYGYRHMSILTLSYLFYYVWDPINPNETMESSQYLNNSSFHRV